MLVQSSDTHQFGFMTSSSSTPFNKTSFNNTVEKEPLCPRLDEQLWYHGVIPSHHLFDLLKNTGDWLVYGSERMVLISNKEKGDKQRLRRVVYFRLAVKVASEPRSIPINFEKASKSDIFQKKDVRPCVQLEGEHAWHLSIFHLIAYYHDHAMKLSQNESGVKLTRSVPRPSWMILHKELSLRKELGSGQYASVRYGILRQPGKGKTYVAVKIPTSNEKKNVGEDMLREAKLMATYKHRNVTRMYGIAADVPPIKIVMEFCGGGALLDYLQKHCFSKDRKMGYIRQAAAGVAYLHDVCNIIHGDLAARNCLLDQNHLTLKISDFGLSLQLRSTQKFEIDKDMMQSAVPIPWLAPELLSRNPRRSKSADVYAYAMLLWEVFSNGQMPWGDKPTKEIICAVRSGKRPPLPKNIPPIVMTLVELCWSQRASSRPTCADIANQLFKRRNLNACWKDVECEMDETQVELVDDDRWFEPQLRHIEFSKPTNSWPSFRTYAGVEPRKASHSGLSSTNTNGTSRSHCDGTLSIERVS